MNKSKRILLISSLILAPLLFYFLLLIPGVGTVIKFIGLALVYAGVIFLTEYLTVKKASDFKIPSAIFFAIFLFAIIAGCGFLFYEWMHSLIIACIAWIYCILVAIISGVIIAKLNA